MTQAAEVTTDSRSYAGDFFSISPAMVLQDQDRDFSLFLKQGEQFVLYTKAGEHFTGKHQTILESHGVECLFVPEEERPDYCKHVENNLGQILDDESLPLPTRAEIFYEISSGIVEDILQNKLPPTVRHEQFYRILEFVTKGVSFLTVENSLKTMAGLIGHDYHTFSHSVHVFIYSQAILQTYGFDEKSLVQFGLGAMLHDIGKTGIDEAILNKPGPLTHEERLVIEEHPVLGAGACTLMPLSQDALNCILFHHEKLDGTGYPCRLKEVDIPLPVRAVTIADIYDALASDRPYAQARNPFQVLRTMRDEMTGQIDKDVFARFVRILSGAGQI